MSHWFFPLIGTYTARGSLSSIAECECTVGHSRIKGVCVACAEGSYKDQAGDVSCSVCHTNSQSPAASISAEACYCIADFFGPPLGPCTACPANSHALAGSVLGDSCACNAGYGHLSHSRGREGSKDTSMDPKMYCTSPYPLTPDDPRRI